MSEKIDFGGDPYGLSLGDLRTYCALADYVDSGDTLEAAESKAKISSASRFLEGLEKSLLPAGAVEQFIKRGKGRVSKMTPAGLFFRGRARAIVAAFDEARSKIGRERITVMAATSVIAFALPLVMLEGGDFLGQFPEIDLAVEAGESTDIPPLVESYRVTVGIGTAGFSRGDVKAIPLPAIPRVLVCRRGHRFKTRIKRGQPFPVEALAKETVFVLPPETVPGFRMQDALPPPEPGIGRQVVLPSYDLMLAWCQRGLGVALGFRGALGLGDAKVLEEFPLEHLKDRFPDGQATLFVREGWEKNYSDAAKNLIGRIQGVFRSKSD